MQTLHMTSKEQFLSLSYHSLCVLADLVNCVYPHYFLPPLIAKGVYKGLVTLDDCGNLVNFE